MEQGASMESVAQFLLGCDTASGKKHYHWNCNCALHGQCGHSSPAKVDVSSGSKNTKSQKAKSISSSSTRSVSVSDLTSLRSEKRLYSMGNLLELLDSSKSNEEIRRAAANKEPL